MTTAAEVPSPTSGGQPEAELAERALVLPPVVPHLHVQLQEHLDAEEGLQLPAGLAADALEHAAALADENALLGILLHEDRGPNVQLLRSRALGQLLHPHRHRVG